MEMELPITPMPTPNTAYTEASIANMSLNVSSSYDIIFFNELCNTWSLSALYAKPIISIEIKPATTPIIIPSTINGQRIKLFVAPTYFIIDISFLLACTVSFIVFDIINVDINTSNTIITILVILTPFARLTNFCIVS